MHQFFPALVLAALATFVPSPPGSVVESQVVYLNGQAMHSEWRGVVSKKAVGTGDGETFYQWYVSIYQIDGTTYRLRYRSPVNGGPLDKLEKATGASMWFPRQSAGIVGAAALMGDGVEQLVVQSHQTGADCGSADLTVFAYDAKRNKIVPAVTVENGCDLDAKIVKNGDGAMLRLSGPYYNEHAPMCCPTKENATATLKYTNGKWIETPNYYNVYPKSFPKP